MRSFPLRFRAALSYSAQRWALTLLLSFVLAGCVSTEARVKQLDELRQPENRSLFVVSASHKKEAAESLRRVGFQIVDDMLESPHYLRVTAGVQKGSRTCGSLHNVKYDLRQGGRSVVALTRSGWMGTCEPNVFEQLAQDLADRFDRAGAD